MLLWTITFIFEIWTSTLISHGWPRRAASRLVGSGPECALRHWRTGSDCLEVHKQRALHGLLGTNFNSLIWKAWAPGKCKFHAWLIIQNRVWTSGCLRLGGGKITVVALFTAARLRRHCTSLPLVDIPRWFGTLSLHGWAINSWSRLNGRKPSLSNNSGRASQTLLVSQEGGSDRSSY